MPPINNNRISGEPPSASPSPKPKTKLFLIAVIMISIFSLFILLIGIASVILLPLLLSSLHRHHRRRRRDRRHDSSDGLSSRFVKQLPQIKLSESTYKRYGSDCVICLDGFRQGQWCRNLPGCGHVFHRKCVDTWLLKSSTCPICRARVRLREDDADDGELWRCFGHRRSSLLDLFSLIRKRNEQTD